MSASSVSNAVSPTKTVPSPHVNLAYIQASFALPFDQWTVARLRAMYTALDHCPQHSAGDNALMSQIFT